MEKINASGKEWGSFDYKESAVGLILGGMFNEFSMGAHLRFLMGTMGDYKGSGFSMDLGSIFQLADFLNFGLALNNLGGYKLEDISVDLPFTVRAGVGVVLETFDSDYKFGLDLENDSVGTFYRFGGEYINHEGFRLRAGINTVESGFQYSLGTGFSTPETRWGGIFNLNYSFTGGGELGEYIHRFDVGLNYIPDFY
ncbi:MAG: hypothetical protein GX817_00275 [Elusimicrobia bacterium]|nr:hypothetical protein [Elusimicrobiota bacterium]